MTEKPNACCNDPDNLEQLQDDHNLVIVECRVCGRKHYEFTVDPGELGVKGVSL